VKAVYQFDRQLSIGAQYEAQLDAHFARWFSITPASRAQQRHGIDRVFVHRQTGKRYTVEYKADTLAGSTGNAFIEVESIDAPGRPKRPGWAMSSQADVLIYLVVEPETIYALRLRTLRKRLGQWRQLYPLKAAQNEGYRTWGHLVPLAELEEIAMEVQ
jgi:hypothetical protein